MRRSNTKEISNQNPTLTAWRLVRYPILIALALSPIRFAMEYAGLPEKYIFLIGLLWLTLGFAIYWGIKLAGHQKAILMLFLCLCIFSPISRIPVAILWWVDTNWNLGTHYGDYFETFGQALYNQIGYGALVQLIPGFLVGVASLLISQSKKAKTIQHG